MPNLDLLIDLYANSDRLGPGSEEETRRAIELARIDKNAPLNIADLGCGTGASALTLAKELPNAKITAIDAAEPFISRLNERTQAAGVAGRISAQVGDMAELDLPKQSFDVIWSEGAIYNIGFSRGLQAWKHLLKPGGVIAVSELSWTTNTRPAAVDDYWSKNYPAIMSATANMQATKEAGLEPLGFFFLPQTCWLESYYAPLEANIPTFLEQHNNSDEALAIAKETQDEIAICRDYGAHFSYGFYIARKP